MKRNSKNRAAKNKPKRALLVGPNPAAPVKSAFGTNARPCAPALAALRGDQSLSTEIADLASHVLPNCDFREAMRLLSYANLLISMVGAQGLEPWAARPWTGFRTGSNRSPGVVSNGCRNACQRASVPYNSSSGVAEHVAKKCKPRTAASNACAHSLEHDRAAKGETK
jgi:hypothetical protein